jgi:hypothetical protein
MGITYFQSIYKNVSFSSFKTLIEKHASLILEGFLATTNKIMAEARESLLKGKAQYSWLPHTN